MNGINNDGDVIGFSSDNAANPTLLTNFIRAANGTFTALNIGGDPLAMANGINDMDAVVGASNGSAFLRAGGILSTLPNVNGTTLSETVFGLNSGGLGGLVVGQYVDSNTGNTPGFLFNGTGFTTLTPAVTATVTNAQGVNNLGEATGFYSVDGVHQHSFFYNATTQNVTLPADPSVANLFLTQVPGHQRQRPGGGLLPVKRPKPARLSV